ncbi:MAG: hypothetical protein ABIV47_11735, partial [Roseiflexaceae bacterium]
AQPPDSPTKRHFLGACGPRPPPLRTLQQPYTEKRAAVLETVMIAQRTIGAHLLFYHAHEAITLTSSTSYASLPARI